MNRNTQANTRCPPYCPRIDHRSATVFALTFILVVLGGRPAYADNNEPAAPQAAIHELITKTLTLLDSNPDGMHNDPRGMMARIAEVADPYVDFSRVSEEVLGVGWRRADKQQRARFVKAFRQLLLDDYAAVFKQYTGQTIKITGARWTDDEHHRATVSSLIEKSAEESIKVDYRVYEVDGQWKIYDVVVDGVSLLINYRDVFASELEQGTLDALIAQLEKKVAGAPAPTAQ